MTLPRLLSVLLFVIETSTFDINANIDSGSRQEIATTDTPTSTSIFGINSASDYDTEISSSDIWTQNAFSKSDGEDLFVQDTSIFGPTDYLDNESNVRWKRKSQRKNKQKTTAIDNDKKNETQNSGVIPNSQKLWIDSDITNTNEASVKMNAFIIKDESISGCHTPAEAITDTRYYMCSGAVLTRHHVITSASCMNHAAVNEKHIEAKTAVLVGALSDTSYVIMVALYVLHPEYTPDPQSQKYELHNIAVITLLCPIPAQVAIAVKLPTQQYSDIGHMCCSEKCKLLTVIENTQNYHFVKEMRIRNVPRPVHKEKNKNKDSGMDLNIMYINQPTQRENENYKRLVRSPGIAPVPQFFTQEKLNIKSKPKKHKGRKKNDFPISLRGRDIPSIKTTQQAALFDPIQSIYDVQMRSGPDAESTTASSDARDTSAKSTVEAEAADASTQAANNDTASTTEAASESSAAKLETSTKGAKTTLETSTKGAKTTLETSTKGAKTTLETSTKGATTTLETSTKGAAAADVSSTAASASKKNATKAAKDNPKSKSDSIVTATTDAKVSGNNTSSDNETSSVEDTTNMESPDLMKNVTIERNVLCPPLGTPIIVDNTLIALIAYTCDDLQDWVEWKYVNIETNLQWITKQIEIGKKEEYNMR